MVLLAALECAAEFRRTITPGVPQIRVDDARTQHAEANALAVFQPKCVGEAEYGMLRGDIGRDTFGRRTHRVMRGRIADPGFRVSGKEAPAERATTVEYAIHIHLELPTQIVVGRIKSSACRDDARIVAEDFDVSQLAPRHLGQLLDRFGAAH